MKISEVLVEHRMGINIRADGDIDYAELIADGKKKYETRNTDSLKPYVGKTVAIVRTGRGPASAIGEVTIGKPIVADEKTFEKLRKQHLVPAGSKFDIPQGGVKYLYPMLNPVRWDKEKPVTHHGIVARQVQYESLNEVNIDTDYNPDELTVKQKFIDYFTDKGYNMIGEGRDQIAFLSPRNTVLKVLGLGDTARQQAVEHYVEFFERNQRNPFYPKIYNSQRFTFEGDSYFLYETEYLTYVSNEDDTLDWLERYLNHLGTDPVAAQEWIETNGVPDDIGEDQLYGLTQSTEDIIEYLAGPNGYMMDLSNIENIRRRGDGHLVIVDPISI